MHNSRESLILRYEKQKRALGIAGQRFDGPKVRVGTEHLFSPLFLAPFITIKKKCLFTQRLGRGDGHIQQCHLSLSIRGHHRCGPRTFLGLISPSLWLRKPRSGWRNKLLTTGFSGLPYIPSFELEWAGGAVGMGGARPGVCPGHILALATAWILGLALF